jgi:hypothetical protein
MSAGGRGRVGAWRIALLLLALVAASAQQLVAQTHWHVAAAAQIDAGSESPAPAAPGSGHDDCLLCQIAAHAGAAAPPAAMLLAAVAVDIHAVRVPSVRYPAVIPGPAHAWQSRGPPTA